MKHYLFPVVLLFCSMFPMIAEAYDRHGKDYSVRDGGGSSGILGIVVIVGIVLYCCMSGGKNEK